MLTPKLLDVFLFTFTLARCDIHSEFQFPSICILTRSKSCGFVESSLIVGCKQNNIYVPRRLSANVRMYECLNALMLECLVYAQNSDLFLSIVILLLVFAIHHSTAHGSRSVNANASTSASAIARLYMVTNNFYQSRYITFTHIISAVLSKAVWKSCLSHRIVVEMWLKCSRIPINFQFNWILIEHVQKMQNIIYIQTNKCIFEQHCIWE